MPQSEKSINTQGGSSILGNVNTSGDFIGRDKIIETQNVFTSSPLNLPYVAYLRRLLLRINRFLELVLTPNVEKNDGNLNTIPLKLKPKSIQYDPLIFELAKIRDQTEYENIQAVYDSSRNRILLIGEPGAGKTVALMLFAREAISRRLRDASNPLPILGIVPTWDYHKQPTMSEWLKSSFGAPEDTEVIIREGKALLLLDGLDELIPDMRYGGDPQLLFVQQIPDNNHVVLTCRNHNYGYLQDELTRKMLEVFLIDSLSDDQILSYTAGYTLLQHAIRSDTILRSLLNTPLLLTLFAKTFSDSPVEEIDILTNICKDKFEKRDHIIETYLTQRYQRDANTATENYYPPRKLLSLDDLVGLLGAVAYKSLARSPMEDNTILELDMIQDVAGEQTSLLITQATLLQLLVQYREDSYRFSHMYFMYYLVYHYCLRVIPELEYERGDKSSRQLVYVVHVLERTDQLNDARYKRRIIEKSIMLLREFSSDLDKKVNIIYTLVAFGDDAIPFLCAKLKDPEFQPDIIYALCQIDSSTVNSLLLDLLEQEHISARSLVIERLAEIDETRAIRPLIRLLDSCDFDTCINAAEALIFFGNKCLFELEAYFVNRNSPQLEYLLEGIKSLGCYQDINSILAALDDPDPAISLEVAIILVISADRGLVKELIGLLCDDRNISPVVMWLVAQLAKKFPLEAVGFINDNSPKVRRLGVQLLSGIEDSEIIAALISKLDDQDIGVRFAASVALTEIGESAMELLMPIILGEHQLIDVEYTNVEYVLLQELRNSCLTSDLQKQFASISALGIWCRINRYDSTVLIEALRTDDEKLQYHVSLAIVATGGPTYKYVYDALQHPDERVRNVVSMLVESLSAEQSE